MDPELAAGTAEGAGTGDPGAAAAETQAGASSATAQPESFINPADLPPELKPHWSRMHSAYTKALNRTKEHTQKAALVDQFWSDPAYAKQSIEAWAQAQGLSVNFSPPGGHPASPQAAQAAPQGGVPAEYVQAIEANLPPELKWMAKALAASTWTAQASLLTPFLRRSQEREASERTAQYDQLAQALSETAPGWEAHEDDMNDLLTFLQGPEMQHRRWGSKLQLLYTLATGDASATRDAVRRMGEAARARSSTGMPGRSTTVNIEERVRGAKSNHEAFKLAAEHAMEQLRKDGVPIP